MRDGRSKHPDVHPGAFDCKQYRLPIKVVNLNNRYMGMVRQWQEFFHGNRYAESYMDALPDFVKLAESYGHVGMRIEKPGDVESALKEAFARQEGSGVYGFCHRSDRERGFRWCPAARPVRR